MKYYAIDWMLDDFYYFNNEEKVNALKDEIRSSNEIDKVNIDLVEIENINLPGGLLAIIIRASKEDMLKLGYDEIEINEFEVFI